MHALWLRRGLRLRKLLCLRGLLMDLPCLLQLCVLLLFLPPRIIVCHIFWILRALSAVHVRAREVAAPESFSSHFTAEMWTKIHSY